jgi:hypothetical protein
MTIRRRHGSSRVYGVTACLLASSIGAGAQLLPPPRDGEISVLYNDITKETEIWLTLEPAAADGKPAPPGMILTFTFRFPGKTPKGPPTSLEANAYAGRLWAPKVAYWVVLDDREKIELAPPGMVALSTGTVSDYVPATISVATLARIARAKRVNGNALGWEFELTGSQHKAIFAFLERIL